MKHDLPQRLLDLAADRALGSLSPDEQRELDALLAEHGDDALLELELAAAELELEHLDDQGVQQVEPLPAALRERLVREGLELVGARALRPTPAPAPRPLAPWLLAAAAAALAVVGWWPRAAIESDTSRVYAELRALPGAMVHEWAATEHAPGAAGEVVWSQDQQRGVMRIRGLFHNDPTVEQFQLWIIDGTQEHPIDGGVFDVVGDEVLIPIDAKLAVADPKAFAVTVEKPGGVVVSAQERVVLLAAL
ncbi:MAG TPA: anti-sigma factor [Planctomycetota bacterium]|nr:anti-sigma factor [Planctomycetota bacterium]